MDKLTDPTAFVRATLSHLGAEPGAFLFVDRDPQAGAESLLHVKTGRTLELGDELLTDDDRRGELHNAIENFYRLTRATR